MAKNTPQTEGHKTIWISIQVEDGEMLPDPLICEFSGGGWKQAEAWQMGGLATILHSLGILTDYGPLGEHQLGQMAKVIEAIYLGCQVEADTPDEERASIVEQAHAIVTGDPRKREEYIA